MNNTYKLLGACLMAMSASLPLFAGSPCWTVPPQQGEEQPGPVAELMKQRALQSEADTTAAAPLPGMGRMPKIEDARQRNANPEPRQKRVSSATAADVPQFQGNVLWNDQWQASGSYDYNVSRFTLTDGQISGEVLSSNPRLTGNGGALFNDGKFYVTYFKSYAAEYHAFLTKFETDNWTNLYGDKEYEEVGVEFISPSGVSVDPTSGYVYGYFYDKNLSSLEFGLALYDNTYRMSLGRYSGPTPITFAFNSKGEAYAISNQGDLYSVNKENGKMTLIGATGLTPGAFIQSMAFDLATDRLYWDYVDANIKSSLYEVDTATGQASYIASFPNNEVLVGLNIIQKEANDGAPAAVTDISFDFPNGATSGTLGFDVPSVTYGGGTLTGEVSYTITANEQAVASGTAQAGSRVNASVQLTEGDNKVEVVLENGEGKGPRFFTNRWIGYDYPKAIANVNLSIVPATGKISLAWDPVTGGVNAGYVDPANIVYTITDDVAGTVAGTATGTTSFELTAPDCFYKAFAYKVTPKNGSREGEAKLSNLGYYGKPYTIPYSCTFGSFYDFAPFLSYDFNSGNDGRTWAYDTYTNTACALTSDVEQNDDWLLSPEITLTADRQYILSVEARCYGSSYPEKFEAALGQGTNPKTSFRTILEPTVVDSDEFRTFTAIFAPEADGNYRIGLHNIGDPNKYVLYVNSIGVSQGSMLSAPAAVTNLEATAGAAGAASARISFSAPTATIADAALGDLSKIEVYRDGKTLVKNITDATPGKAYTVSDDACTANAMHTYTVVAHNGSGAGSVASVSVFVGFDTPTVPGNVKVVDNFDDSVTIKWDKVTTGANGGYVDADKVSYELYRYVPGETFFDPDVLELEKGNIKDNRVILALEDNDGKQKRTRYVLRAVSEGGAGEITGLFSVITGRPDNIPYYESFPNRYENSLWMAGGFLYEHDVDWVPGSVESFAYWYPTKENDSTTLTSGKIGMAGAVKPTLYFNHYAEMPQADFSLNVAVRLSDDREEQLGTFKYSEMTGTNGWIQSKFDLSKYKNEPYIYLVFTAGGSEKFRLLCLDNVKVYDTSEGNMAATLSAPASIIPGISSPFPVNVYNCTENASASSVVRLYANGELVDEKEVSSIPALGRNSVILNYKRIANAPEEALMHAEVVSASDINPADNVTPETAVKVSQPRLPVATSLAGAKADDGIRLSWNAPEYAPRSVDEGFEDLTPWTINPESNWYFVDGDGKSTVAPYTPEFYGMLKPMAFIVFNLHETNYEPSEFPMFEAHNGQQMLATFATQNGTPSDDWLISEPLDGKKQTVSFYTRCLSFEAPEILELMYSDKTYDPSDFKAVKEVTVTNEDWEQVEFEVPEGAAYFAIHVKSTAGYMLQIDDVAFSTGDFRLDGYNIYRDNKLIATADAAATSYTDTAVAQTEGAHDYTVTAVYSVGESAPSNHILAGMTGIGDIVAPECLAGVDVEVFNLAGMRIAEGSDVIAKLPAGLYLIRRKDNGRTLKTIVR